MKAKKKQGKASQKEKVKNGGVKKRGSGGGGKNNAQSGPPRPQKKSKGGKKGEWNLVPIGEEFFSDKEFENLVSFEELVEYDVVTKDDGTKEILSGKGDNDDKNSKGDSTKAELDIDDEVEVRDSGKKKKQKEVKKQNNKTVIEGETSGAKEVIFTSAGPVIVEDDNDDLQGSQKMVPDKRKKRKATETSTPNKIMKKEVKPEAKRKQKMAKADVDVEQTEINSNDELDVDDDFLEDEWMKLGVPSLIVKALKEKKFNKPTNIQALTLPASILGKKDIVGAAETGSGKTLAFAIPIIDGIMKQRDQANNSSKQDDVDEQSDDEEVDQEEHDSLKALILTPTRELAVQIKNHFDVAAKYTDVKTVVIVGGLASQKQERLLKSRPDVVIATPGRLWELVQEGDPHLSTLNRIKYLAIDETDRMVEKGHFQELEGILSAVNTNEESIAHRQNFIFSATLAFTHEPPQRLKKIGNKKVKFMQKQPKKMSTKEKLKQIMEMVGVRPNPKIVDITTSKGTCETLTEMQISCSLEHKDYYLYYFLVFNTGRTIVFCNSINCVRRLTNLFFLLQCGEVLPLHSEMHQKQRLRNLERFTANEKGVLIATDVAARGLDIQNIEHVIHYQVPKTAESYIHRSGRTARAFKGGIAILMIEPSETTNVKNIFRSLGRDEMLPAFNVDGKKFRDIKSTVEMAIKVEQFEHSVRKKLAEHNWMEKAKKDMDLASSSDDSDEEDGTATSQKKSLLTAKKQLENYKKTLSQMVLNNNSKLLTLG